MGNIPPNQSPGFGLSTLSNFCFFLFFSGVFELNFMSSQPASGYYQFTVAVTGDSRLVANHVEVSLSLLDGVKHNLKQL